MRTAGKALNYLIYPVSYSEEACGENMLWAMLESQVGWSRRNDKGDDIGDSRYYGSEEIEKKLWKHTEEEMGRVLA